MSKQKSFDKEEVSLGDTTGDRSKRTTKNKHSSSDSSDSENEKPKSSAKKRRSDKHREDLDGSREREASPPKSRRDRRASSEVDKGCKSPNDSDGQERRHRSSSNRHQRYWGRGDSESRSSRRNNDRYWNKYQSKDEDRSVGSRYYGDNTSRERKRDDKENYQNKRRHDGEGNPERRDDRRSKTNRSQDKDDKSTAEAQSNQEENPPPPKAPKKVIDMLTSKTGGAYIPPARLRMMQAQITDKSSAAYQRISWEALKKSIHGHINKVNTGNIGIIVRELLKENVVRGRGLLCRSIIQAQAASITFTHVYAGLVAVINCKFPKVGELLLKRLIIQFKRGFKRNDKSVCISASTFIAHLVNQRVAHEILALEILTLLVETPTDDSVEVAIAFLKECGSKLLEVSNKGILAIFEMLRNILHEGQLEKRVQYMIEVMFQVRKDNFKDHEAVISDLDLVGEDDQFTHLITLEDVTDPEDLLNVFKLDPDFEVNEGKYKALKEELLDEESSGDESGSGSSEEDDSDAESESAKRAKEETIIDNTETNLVALRRTIYLTIHSSLDFEECAHKLMRMELKPGQEIELCHMFLDCCAEQRTYEKFYGLLSQRFCMINKIFVPPFQQIFRDTYETIHRLDINKLRNVAKFFAHLLFTDAISWEVLSLIRLNEEDTSSSSRIFIKILFQELSEYMGLTKLNDRVKDVTLQSAFDGLFPRDDPKNTRFAVNFFTSIGLGGLTDELREHLKAQSKLAAAAKIVPPTPVSNKNVPDESSSSDSSSSSSSSSSSDSSSESESSDEDSRKKSKKRSKKMKKKAPSKAPIKKASRNKKSRSPLPSKHRSSRR